MPAYHSAFNGVKAPELCGLAVLPLKTKVRGPASMIDARVEEEDIIDESIRLFRANVLFRNFEVQGAGDRVLIYLTLFIHQCLKKCEKVTTKAEGSKVLNALATSAHVAPGEAGWPLGTLLPAASGPTEAENTKAYLKQLRETLAPRLLERIFNADGTPNKFWMQYSKRKFLNKEFL